jgi:ribose transport system permease protein
MPHDASALGPGARPAGPARPEIGSVAISDVTGVKEQTVFERLFSSQAFWVTVALVIICVVMTILQPDAFASRANFYNITRNFAFIGIMAIGMTAVIITGGIDLSSARSWAWSA